MQFLHYIIVQVT